MSSLHAVFAHAGGAGGGHGLDWGMMGMGWLLMLMIAGLVAWMLIRAAPGPTPTDRDPTSSAQRILAERFARGDIDDEEYQRRSAELSG